MCKECENDYEKLIECYAELEAKYEALDSAMQEVQRCYKRLSEENVQLVITNAHLMKKVYYDNRA